MVKVLHNPNLFSFIFIFSMFSRGTEAKFFFQNDRKSAVYSTLTNCQNLAMCSHDACNAGYVRAMRALWALCGRDARYVRAQHAGHVDMVTYCGRIVGYAAVALSKNAKKSSCVGASCAPPCEREALSCARGSSHNGS